MDETILQLPIVGPLGCKKPIHGFTAQTGFARQRQETRAGALQNLLFLSEPLFNAGLAGVGDQIMSRALIIFVSSDDAPKQWHQLSLNQGGLIGLANSHIGWLSRRVQLVPMLKLLIEPCLAFDAPGFEGLKF